ncbi:Cobyric acid synthase [Streptomyces fumanus]
MYGGIDEEDGLRISLRGAVRESDTAPPVGEDVLRVAVCAVPLMSNFTDVDALAAEPGVLVRFVDRPEELADADLVIVPGTRHGPGTSVAAGTRTRRRPGQEGG